MDHFIAAFDTAKKVFFTDLEKINISRAPELFCFVMKITMFHENYVFSPNHKMVLAIRKSVPRNLRKYVFHTIYGLWIVKIIFLKFCVFFLLVGGVEQVSVSSVQHKSCHFCEKFWMDVSPYKIQYSNFNILAWNYVSWSKWSSRFWI